MQLNKNTIIISVISFFLLFGFLFLVYAMTNTKPDETVYEPAKTLKANDHVSWSPQKKHLLVEYADLQCPACRSFYSFIKSDLEKDPEITKNITMVYRHFPLPMHQHARAAAYAAEAAYNQGKFAEMIDRLFEKQPDWENSNNFKEYVMGIAKELKLDLKKFETDMNSDVVKKRVDQDYNTGISVDVSSTPTFYLNGKKLVGYNTFEDFKKFLTDEIKAAK